MYVPFLLFLKKINLCITTPKMSRYHLLHTEPKKKFKSSKNFMFLNKNNVKKNSWQNSIFWEHIKQFHSSLINAIRPLIWSANDNSTIYFHYSWNWKWTTPNLPFNCFKYNKDFRFHTLLRKYIIPVSFEMQLWPSHTFVDFDLDNRKAILRA